MRISVLRNREAFAEILAATLSKFWSHRFETETIVTWSATPKSKSGRGQIWLCNDYLNCIFLPDTPAPSFEPIRREFSRSVQRWKTPFQRAYVTLATHRSTSRWLSHGRLHVRPAVPTQPEQLVVPGNNKVRILSASKRFAWVALKAGFPSEDFLKEIASRQQASAAGVPVPELELVDEQHHWLREHYVVGTPTNRLATSAAQQHAVQAGYASLSPLIESTLERIPEADYVEDLEHRADAGLPALHSIGGALVDRLRTTLERLLGMARGGSSHLVCSRTHGDFQPGNVLVDGDRVWIIDWEYSDRRLAVYDPFVMGLASRFSVGLADRIVDFVKRGPQPEMGFWPARWCVPLGATPGIRNQYAALFLVEELLLHVQENAKPPIHTPGKGLFEMLRQAERFLAISQKATE